MVQSPSWKANWFAASQEIPRILRNPKVHYRTHKRPPTVSILCQSNPVHIPTSHFLEIRHNITHPSMPRSPQWFPSLQFPQQDPIHLPLFTHTHIRSRSMLLTGLWLKLLSILYKFWVRISQSAWFSSSRKTSLSVLCNTRKHFFFCALCGQYGEFVASEPGGMCSNLFIAGGCFVARPWSDRLQCRVSGK